MNRLWTIGLMWLEARVRFCSNCVCVFAGRMMVRTLQKVVLLADMIGLESSWK